MASISWERGQKISGTRVSETSDDGRRPKLTCSLSQCIQEKTGYPPWHPVRLFLKCYAAARNLHIAAVQKLGQIRQAKGHAPDWHKHWHWYSTAPNSNPSGPSKSHCQSKHFVRKFVQGCWNMAYDISLAVSGKVRQSHLNRPKVTVFS